MRKPSAFSGAKSTDWLKSSSAPFRSPLLPREIPRSSQYFPVFGDSLIASLESAIAPSRSLLWRLSYALLYQPSAVVGFSGAGAGSCPTAARDSTHAIRTPVILVMGRLLRLPAAPARI